MITTRDGDGLRRVAGWLLVVGAVAWTHAILLVPILLPPAAPAPAPSHR